MPLVLLSALTLTEPPPSSLYRNRHNFGSFGGHHGRNGDTVTPDKAIDPRVVRPRGAKVAPDWPSPAPTEDK
jgi:hypothetical protein